MYQVPELHAFIGPTGHRLAPASTVSDSSIQVYGPVKRGDIRKLVAELEPSAIAIVDGLFFQSLAVGHAELVDAISKGWQIWGLSSMGAIRAYELRNMGMRGFGKVYEQFFADIDFQDDEVCLIHEYNAPYRPVSEPLVHIREALQHLCQRGLLSADSQRTIAAELKSLWFGDRTWELARQLCRNASKPETHSSIDAALANTDPFQLKSLDLIRFFQRRPWISAVD